MTMRWSIILWVAAALSLLCGQDLRGQPNPDFVLSISSTSGSQGESVDLSLTLDNLSTEPANGWSYGVCHDPAKLTTLDVIASGDVLSALGFTSVDDFGFYQLNILTDGWTVGVVIDLFGQITLPPGSNELNIASYSIDGAAPDTAEVCFCATLGGPPPVDVVVVIQGGTSVTPVSSCGAIEILELVLEFTFIISDVTVPYDAATGVATFDVPISVMENPTDPGFPNGTQGLSMGIAHDPAILAAEAIDLTPLALHLGLSETGDLGFVGPAIFNEGVTVGVVYDLFGAILGFFEEETVVAHITYGTVPSALVGLTEPTITAITWSNELMPPGASQPVVNVLVVDATSVDPACIDGEVTLLPQFDTPFIRGNCNDDSAVNIADGIWLLNLLFQGGPEGPCFEACDMNDDDDLDAADAIYIFMYRLADGPPPPAPFPACGTVPGADCGSTSNCP